ncbi:DMT family transporter [bacterium]|nr:DMT family transporter [bacterium]
MSSEKQSIWWLVGANLVYSLMAFLVRYASYIDSFKVTLFRFAIGMAILGTLAITKKITLEFTKSFILILRGLFGGVAVFVYYWSILNIGLARGTMISNSSTIFATIIGIFVLKESVSFLKMFFIFLTLYGLYLMVGSGAVGAVNIKEGIAILGAVISGAANVIIKKARETESTHSVFFSQCVIGFWLVLIPANLIPIKMNIGGGFILLAIGVTAAVGQLMTTYAYKFNTVATASLISTLHPVFNLVIGLTIFNEPFTSKSFIGMVIVLVSCYMVVMSEDYTKKIHKFIDKKAKELIIKQGKK